MIKRPPFESPVRRPLRLALMGVCLFGMSALWAPQPAHAFRATLGFWRSVNVWFSWLAGSSATGQAGTYGTKGTGATTNIPGARKLSVSFKDSADNLWLFSGASALGEMNDLWKYEPATGKWTWVSGSSSGDQVASFGTKGTAASGNIPGGRDTAVSWRDSSDNLWVFGGWGFNATTQGFLNDLWKFDPTSGWWTWISGSSSLNQSGTYGTKGTGSTSNTPGGRTDTISWVDSSGNHWLFGG